MKKLILAALICLNAPLALASETCYQLSTNGSSWSRTAELLCVNDSADLAEGSILTLKINNFGNSQIVAEFSMDLLMRSKCIDCNKDIYGVANPSNSIFNALSVKFDGKKSFNSSTHEEQGTVSIGANTFFYKKVQ